ncbi:MAG TPA: ribonuclease III, partial [Polyangiaceae bacterium]|nr:ribonuclease III [Polyangiaceae bacterium]
MSDGDEVLAKIAAMAALSPDSAALQQALTHPSLANEQRGLPHNQRLEFLGDAVLGLCASEELYKAFPDADEGALTRLRAQLVNAEALATWGRLVGLPGALRVGRGAAGAGLRESTNVLADAVEALIAASYVEVGLDAARRLSAEIVQHGLASAGPAASAARDAKSELQERLQALGQPAPVYELVEATGPAHDRRFRVRVSGAGED